MREWNQIINGKSVSGEGSIIDIFNPDTGESIAKVNSASVKQAKCALESADKAFKTWSMFSLSEREKYIRNFRDVLLSRKDEIIDLLIKETGKSYSVASYDFNMLPDCLDFFIEEAKRKEGSIIPDYTGKHVSALINKPLGVVVGHLAWNFPILNLGYKLGPILASGCTCVLKPSIQTPLTAALIGEISIQSGMPAGVINIIIGTGKEIYETLNGSTIPKMITLIGSSQTGRNIILQSSSSIKHYSLELGGNAPVIVMKDADIAQAAYYTADGKFGNSGQVCVAPNRVFVHKDIKEKFICEVKKFAENITLGSGNKHAEYLIGPLVSKEAQQHMKDLVKDAISKGAVLVCGGKSPKGNGYYFEPTIFSGVTKEMRIYKEEIFGPIMGIITFDDNDDVISLANDTEYGLASYVYTKNLSTALMLSTEIDSGNVCVNEPFYNFNLPHGGCKESGIGKDCSRISLDEYYYVQRVSIKL